MSSVADQDILLEQEADERRIVEENWLAEIVSVTKQRMAEMERARNEENDAQQRQMQASESTRFVERLQNRLGISVPVERVQFEEVGGFGEWFPVVYFGGVTFGCRAPSSGYGYEERAGITIARPCEKGCSLSVWARADSTDELVQVLESTRFRHSWDCTRVALDSDYEIVGPKPSPVERYTAAIKTRRVLQFERAKVKELAIRRILANKGVTFNGESFVAGSASAAEKLVEFDEGYAAHCAALTDAVVAEITAREALRAAGGGAEKEDEES